ncbi:MAG: alanine racemase [Anaerovoracaceae bacterium]
MYKNAIRPVWVEINLDNLDYNIQQIQTKIGENTKIIGVIKADAYGHGALEVAKVLEKNGVKIFAVATLQEAITLREGGRKEEIIMLGLTPALYADILVAYDITPVVNAYENCKAISDAAIKLGKTIHGLVAIDTGMGRIGYLPEDTDIAAEIHRANALPGFHVKGIFSHFATADAKNKNYALAQESKYNSLCKKLEESGIALSMKTLANSAAVMELPSAYFDAVRPGIILYGCYPSSEVDKHQLSLRPVMSVKANIIHIKTVPPGFSVGYGRKFIASRESRIATIGLGYADGYPRPFSALGNVIINGVMAPLAGNICMDQCMIDVTDVPHVQLGDEVIIMGSDGQHSITADDIASATGTINYEIVCAFGQRLPKVYISNKEA